MNLESEHNLFVRNISTIPYTIFEKISCISMTMNRSLKED